MPKLCDLAFSEDEINMEKYESDYPLKQPKPLEIIDFCYYQIVKRNDIKN